MLAMLSKYLFYIAAAIDGIGILIGAWMMLDDELKGRHATNNPTMFGLVAGAAALVAVAWWLKNNGYVGIATSLACIPATPLALYGVFILLFIILRPDMK